MSIASGTPNPLELREVIPVFPGLCRGVLLASFMGLFSQLIGAELSHAGEAIQSDENIVGPAAAGDRQLAGTSPVASKTEESVSPYVKNEVHCLALNIYFEARSEPESGQRAVGHVVMNRVAHAKYPDSVCEVVRQGGEQVLHRCQFSWWCDGRSDRPMNRKAWDQSRRLAREIYFGISKDTTDGALWYHATYVKPYWSDLLLKGDKIGQHVFYLENRRSRETM